jgi:hypothetical protein
LRCRLSLYLSSSDAISRRNEQDIKRNDRLKAFPTSFRNCETGMPEMPACRHSDTLDPVIAAI